MSAGNRLVYMHRTEKPALESAGIAQLFKICVKPRDAYGLVLRQFEETLNFHGRLMGNNNVDLAARLFQIFTTLKQLGTVGYFTAGPVIVFKTDVKIRALAAAHCEELHSFNSENLTTHQMVKIASNSAHLAAVPFADFVLFKQLKVFMSSVNKTDVEFALT